VEKIRPFLGVSNFQTSKLNFLRMFEGCLGGISQLTAVPLASVAPSPLTPSGIDIELWRNRRRGKASRRDVEDSRILTENVNSKNCQNWTLSTESPLNSMNYPHYHDLRREKNR
jgi:hypothetical protein